MWKCVRGLRTTVSVQNKAASSIKKSQNINEIPKLKGPKTIYNPRTSASNYKGYLKKRNTPGLYFDPAPSSSTGSINSETIPLAFLPPNDPRRKFAEQIRQNDRLNVSDAPSVLLSKSSSRPEGKTYHLMPEQIEEIKKLRASDPEKYTRKVLAKQFDVSPLFISLVSSASKERLTEMDRRLKLIKNRFHPKRAIARDDRKKRKELWYRA
ncbi:hypothetical protein TBLA_0A09230 [Henningerozyma blattae CBS 6284]|uniref:Uncharacterized protein n=1 Tax=Henningerozyma blattae (strain ATCC 34711 / CBS 6284 / DSM 70876 / NBRC 10599 / NRRL Y-10934 / UCD 77-7) TaxID=1071380 RepID=I2GX59_HENB6|nr:hypothetical protein TBLA_0A09230 [Tetrapisispora blattae CBS 6284]CCH58711.1 hypothetical protein TBLA_0A09230 [Tetrapisispora blattae CBS 6284]